MSIILHGVKELIHSIFDRFIIEKNCKCESKDIDETPLAFIELDDSHKEWIEKQPESKDLGILYINDNKYKNE